MGRNGSEHVVQTDSELLRFHNELLDFVSQQMCSFGVTCFRQRRNDCTNSWSGLQQPGSNQVRDDLVSRIWIDLEFLAEEAHRGKRVSRTQLPGNHRLLRGIDDLLVQRNAWSKVHAERNH